MKESFKVTERNEGEKRSTSWDKGVEREWAKGKKRKKFERENP